MSPTHIIFSRDRLLFRLGATQIAIIAGQAPPHFAEGTPAHALLHRWHAWRAGQLTDLSLITQSQPTTQEP